MKKSAANGRNDRKKMAGGYNPDPGDDAVLEGHMDTLFRKYPGQYVVVAGGELFVGKNPTLLCSKARRLHPDVTPYLSRIPRPKDLFCVL